MAYTLPLPQMISGKDNKTLALCGSVAAGIAAHGLDSRLEHAISPQTTGKVPHKHIKPLQCLYFTIYVLCFITPL